MDGTLLVAGGTALLTGLGITEFLFHQRNLRSIPIRIHVNGTRGKSGVTRLIAAGLRAGGIRTCAKTTGTLPRMIFPDGHEYPVFRPAAHECHRTDSNRSRCGEGEGGSSCC